MPESRRLLLRVLYTINSSNYILARSPVPVPVTLINDDVPDIQPYGAVSFKTCLEAICRSSPELMHDRSKDYSVYVLDPLESNAIPAPLDISNSTGGRSTDVAGSPAAEQSRGVAVGMGLMSWALSVEEKDPITVVGTLGKTGTGQDAIEVIVALRETTSVDQTRLSNPSRSWNTPQANSHTQSSIHRSSSSDPLPPSVNELPSAETRATIASIHNRTKAKNKPKKPPRVSSTPVTESDKLLSADTYIGPIRKKGRPKGQTNGESKVKPEDSAGLGSQNLSTPLSHPTPSNRAAVSTGTTVQPDSSTDTAGIQVEDPSCSPPPGGVDMAGLAGLFSSSQNEAAQNALLFRALSFIDTSNSQSETQAPVNPALVGALRQLLSNVYAQGHSGSAPAPATEPSVPISTNLTPQNGNEGVLDKENVNPSVIRRGSEEEYQHAKLAGDATLSNDSSTETVSQSRGLGARSIENSPPRPVAASAPLTSSSANTRKRTLDDCMEERDNKRNKNQRTKVKERERSEKKDAPRLLNQSNHEDGFKYYPRLMPTALSRPEPGSISYYRTPVETWTSPPRPPKENASPRSRMSDPLGGTSRNRPIVIPDSPQAPRVSASSPIKPTTESKKPYTVPSWARTDTALKPRLSEEVQKTIEQAAKRKREERRANRRKTNALAQDHHRQREKMANTENLETPYSEPIGPSESHRFMQPPPLPVAPNSDLPPIIASSEADLIIFPSTNPRAQSPPPTRTSILLPPVTPKRPSKVASSTPGADDFDEDSLFTPLSIARRSTGMGGSPLFSPGMLGSPLARKRPGMPSPTAYRMTAKQLDSESSTITVRLNEASEDTLARSKSPELELDDTQEDLDCPPSSLPIASSDSEFEDTIMRGTSHPSDQTADGQPTEDGLDDDDELPPHKQHWVGLPPSSPPPPTSPCLMPIDDDGGLPEEVGEELPVASETDEPEEPGDDDMLNTTESDWSPSPADVDDFTITLPVPIEAPENATSDQGEAIDEMAFLREFTTLGSSDGLTDVQGGLQESQNIGVDDISSLFAPCGDHIDFEKFLEGFKPFVPEGTHSGAPDQTPSFDFSAIEGLSNGEVDQSVDHHKIAADLQAILSGCVV